MAYIDNILCPQSSFSWSDFPRCVLPPCALKLCQNSNLIAPAGIFPRLSIIDMTFDTVSSCFKDYVPRAQVPPAFGDRRIAIPHTIDPIVRKPVLRGNSGDEDELKRKKIEAFRNSFFHV